MYILPYAISRSVLPRDVLLPLTSHGSETTSPIETITASVDLQVAVAIMVISGLASLIYANQRANILTIGGLLMYVFVVRAGFKLTTAFKIIGMPIIQTSPENAVILGVMATIGVTVLISIAKRTRMVIFGGILAFIFGLFTGEAVLTLLVNRRLIGDAVLRPYGWSRWGGLQLGIAIGLVLITGLIIFQTQSWLVQWREATDTADGTVSDNKDGETIPGTSDAAVDDSSASEVEAPASDGGHSSSESTSNERSGSDNLDERRQTSDG